MNLLFVCNQGKYRSKTAAELLQNEFSTKYAGLFSDNPLVEKDVEWADIVFFMEEEQRAKAVERFPEVLLRKQLVTLDIPDVYSYNDNRLISLLRRKIAEQTNLQLA